MDSAGVAQATGQQIHDIHPEGDRMTDEDWSRAQEQYDASEDKWPREPTPKMAHAIYYYLVRDLDQESAASISGLRISDLTPITRQINTIDWSGKPGKPENVLKHHPEIYGMIRLILWMRIVIEVTKI
jgi:hypothetical protein